MRFSCLLPVGILLAAGSAQAQRAAATSAGPGRIVCNGTFCELNVGDHPKRRFRVSVARLPAEDVRRLRKCTGVSKPCIVTVDGIEQGDQLKIMATGIIWQD